MDEYRIVEQSAKCADKVSHMPVVAICAMLEELDMGGICLELSNATTGTCYTIHIHRSELSDMVKEAMEERLRQEKLPEAS